MDQTNSLGLRTQPRRPWKQLFYKEFPPDKLKSNQGMTVANSLRVVASMEEPHNNRMIRSHHGIGETHTQSWNIKGEAREEPKVSN